MKPVAIGCTGLIGSKSATKLREQCTRRSRHHPIERHLIAECADAVLSFIKGKGLSARRAQLIWDLVALNSTPSLALHKEPEVAVGTMGIGLDYGGFGVEALPAGDVERILSVFPRLKMKTTIRRDVLSARHGEAGHEPRQLPARLRRAIRAWLQSCVNSRPLDERSVR